MRMFRRVLAIVTRSFYHCNYRQIKKPLARSSTRKSIVYHSNRAQSTNTNTTTAETTSNNKAASANTASSSVINVEHAQRKKARSSFRKRLIYIAAATSLSYIGYKYYFYDEKESENDDKPSVKSAAFVTAQQLIENVLLRNKDMIFKLGVWFDQNKRYKKALYFYKLYLRDAPSKNGEYAALNNMIIIYYRLNEYDLALTAFELIGAAQIISRNLEFIKAHCHHTLLQYDLAVIWYTNYLNNPSSSADIEATYNNLALLYYDIAQYDKAYEYFNKLGDEIIVEKEYLFRTAHCLQQMNEFDKSLAYYLAYLSSDAASHENNRLNVENTYHNLAVLFYDNEKDREAIEMFDKLGDEQLAERDLEFKMAHCCARSGDNKNAIKYLKECMNKKHIYGEYAVICHGIIAQILCQTGKYGEAKEEFDALGEAEIVAQELYYFAAPTYFKCAQYELALKYYQLLAQSEKLSGDELAFVHCRIALCYYKMNKYAQCARVVSDKLSDKQIEEWNMEFIVAHSHHKLLQYSQAKQYYLLFLHNTKSTALDEMNCFHNLALLCFDTNEYEGCIGYFAQLGDDEIIKRKLEFYVAYAHQQLAQYQECIKYYSSYLQERDEHNENMHNAYGYLGDAHYEMKQYEDAIAVWSKLSDTEILKRDLAQKLSECFEHANDEKSAQKYCKLSKQNDVTQRIQMAKMYYDLYQHRDAIKLFGDINDDDICQHNAEFLVAHCYQIIGDNLNAIKYYKLGLRNEDNNGDEIMHVYHNMGCAYHDSANYAEAIECFDKLSEQHIKETNVEFIIAVCYHNLLQTNQALKYYQLFCENPASKTDKENIASCLNNMVILYHSECKDYESAWRVLQKMNEQQIVAKQLQFEAAQIALKLRKNEQAIKYFKLLLQNMAKNQANDEIIDKICENCQSQVLENKENHHDDDGKLLPFIEWIKKQKNDDN